MDNKRATILYQDAKRLFGCGKLSQAGLLLERACTIDPENYKLWKMRGDIELGLQHYKDAQSFYKNSLLCNEDNVVTRHALAETLFLQDQFNEALPHYREIMRLQPDNCDAMNNYGIALQKTGDDMRALQVYKHITSSHPNYLAARYNLGLLLRDSGYFARAVEHFRYVVSLDAGNVEAWNTLGNTLHQLGAFDEALACYERGLDLVPDNADLHYNRALTLLLTGSLGDGWSEYAWHHRTTTCNWPDIPLPVWDGSDCGDLKLLVHGEQGVGDQIMMMSAIPDLLHITDHVVIECDPRLVPLFSRSFPGVTVRADRYHEPGCNEGVCAYAPAGAIFQHLRTGSESFPQHKGYLVVDSAASKRWHDRFARFGDNLKVGISWRGGSNDVRKRKLRSIGLHSWVPMLSLPGISFVNLQYGDSSKAIDAMCAQYGVEIHDFDEADPIRDLDDFAAQISALDLVISIDNSTVHMAGALNVPTWVMLPHYPDWRWRLTGDSSYWYPALRLFRQSEQGVWDAVLKDVTNTLRDLLLSQESTHDI